MTSSSEKLRVNEYLERKKVRLQQVREQSKNIAKNVRSRYQAEENRQLRAFAEKKKAESQCLKRKTIEKLQNDLACCLCEVGSSHKAAFDEVAAEEEWKVQKEFNSLKASIRGSFAANTLQKVTAQQKRDAQNATDKRTKARLISKRTVSNIKQKNPSTKSQSTQRNIQHYYLENCDPENECSNLTENCNLGEVPHLNIEDKNVESLKNLYSDNSKSSTDNRSKQTSTVVSPKKSKIRFIEPKSRLIHDDNFDLHSHRENTTAPLDVASRDDHINLIEVNSIIEDPSMYRVNPVETLKQLSNENHLFQESQFNPTSYINSAHSYYSNIDDEVAPTQSRNFSQKLDKKSCDTQINIVRQHIKDRYTDKSSGPAYSKTSPEAGVQYNHAAIRDTINHAKTAPYIGSTDKAPTIPNLPEYYMRHKTGPVEKDVLTNLSIKKSMDLSPGDDHWVPKLRENHSADIMKRTPIKRILAKREVPSRGVKYVTNNRPFNTQTPPKSGSVRNLPRTLRSFNETNKFTKNIMFDGKVLGERTPRGGEKIFERAKHVNSEKKRIIDDIEFCKNFTTDHLRGEKALDNMRLENELAKIKKEIEQLKNNECISKSSLPETIYIKDCARRECESCHHKIIKKVLENNSIDVESGLTATDTQILQSPVKEKQMEHLPIKCVPASKSPSRSTTSRKTQSNDLDKVPIKGSKDSSASTNTFESLMQITPDEVKTLNVEELFRLVQKQKKELAKKVAMIGLPDKNDNRQHSPRKILPKSKVVVLEDDSLCSSSNEVPIRTVDKKFTKHLNAASSQETLRPNTLVPKGKKLKMALGQAKLKKEKPQTTSSTISSVSSQGLQILIEIKKDKKSNVIKTVKDTEGKENRLTSRELIDSNKMSNITSKNIITIENENSSSISQYDTESTTYMSPPVQITTHFEKLLDQKLASQTNGMSSWEIFQPVDNYKKNVAVIQNRNVLRCRNAATSPDSAESERLGNQYTSQITRADVSTFTQHDNITSVQSKGVQVQILNHTSNTALDVEEVGDYKTSTKHSDPMLKKYIRQLLDMSKNGINNLEIDVSGVTSPGSSIMNVTSNLEGNQSQNTSLEKIDKLKNLLHKNYSLLKELQNDKVASSSSNAGSVAIRDRLRASSKDEQSSIAAIPTKNIEKPKSNVTGQVLPQELKKRPMVNDVPNVDVSNSRTTLKTCENASRKLKDPMTINRTKPDYVRQEINIQDNISQLKSITTVVPSQMYNSNNNNKLNNLINPTISRTDLLYFDTNQNSSSESSSHHSEITDAQYDQLTQECSQKISSFSEMLRKVRKDKEAILSWSASPYSDEEVSKVSQKKSPQELNACENETIPTEMFVPMLSDIPKPQSIDVTRDLQIDQLKSGITSSQNLIANDEQFISLNSFDYSKSQHQNEKPKPPVALVRNPIMRNNNIDTGTPHELSTIAEVDTPITGRNTSAMSKNMLSSSSIVSGIFSEINTPSPKNRDDIMHCNFEKINPVVSDAGVPSMTSSVNITIDDHTLVDISILGSGNKADNNIKFQPFVSFNEYLKKKNPDDVNDEITLGESSDETLPDIIFEMLKRNLIKQPFSSHNSTTHGSAEDSSSSLKSESALFVLTPMKDSRIQKRHHKKNDPSISGVETISNSSSNSRGYSELEATLNAIGIGWAASLLKRTEKAYELSSSSSSAKKENVPIPSKKYNIPPANNPGDISNSSIGPGTPLNDINKSDNLLQKYSTGNILRPSIDEGFEIILQKIDSINKQINKPVKDISEKMNYLKTALAKSNGYLDKSKIDTMVKLDEVGSGPSSKDKTNQRTSTPVIPSMSPSFSPSATGSSQHCSKFLFGMESDLSSVKNISSTDRNLSSDEKFSLSVPNLSLKFGKLFHSSTTMSDK